MNRKAALSEAHRKIFSTYEELKSILPFGFIKTKVCLKPKYEVPNPPILKLLEKEKNKPFELSPTLKTKNLLFNKNIYLFSNDTNEKKIISKFKELQKENSRIPIALKKHIEKNNDTNTRNNDKDLLNNDNNDENENLNYGYKYKSFSINNFNMKSNVLLPSIIDRMKNKISRNIREKDGLSIRGVGLESLKHLNSMDNKSDKGLYDLNKKDDIYKAISNKKVKNYKIKLTDLNIKKNNSKTQVNQDSMEENGNKHEEKSNGIIGMRVIRKIKSLKY